MQNDYIELIQSPPKFQTKKCKAIAFGVRVFLEYTTYFLALLTWFFYNLFYAAAALLVSFLVMGIIRSKMRNASIPISQREFHYNDKGISDWFVGTWWCEGSEFQA